MYQYKFKQDTIVGSHFYYKAGETIYYKVGDYSDAFMETTYNIFIPNGKVMKYCGTIRQSSLDNIKK
jgi:hypothetical protein